MAEDRRFSHSHQRVVICSLVGMIVTSGALRTSSARSIVLGPAASLQAAENSLPQNGGTIRLPCGTFGALTITKSNVQIVGSGICSVITAPASNQAAVITVTGRAQKTLISNLLIAGQAVDQSTTQRCIYLTGGSTGTTIDSVTFAGTTAADGCNIQIHSDPSSSGNVIANNRLTHVIGTGSGGGYGMLIETSNGNVISRNVSIQTETQGRHHIYISAGSSFNAVIGNQLSGGTSDQIVIYALASQPTSRSNLVQGNQLSGMAAALGAIAAIHLSQNVSLNRIVGNRVLHSSRTGICVEASAVQGGPHANDNDVENNSVYFAGQFGILVLGSSLTTVKNNEVYEASEGSPAAYPGIGVSSNGPYAQAYGNSILHNTSYGFHAQRCGLRIDSGAPKPLQTLVSGNRFGRGVFGPALDDGGTQTALASNVLNYINLVPPKP